MTKLNQLGPKECDIIRNEMNKAFGAIQEKLGVTFDIGKMTYSGSSIKVPIHRH